MENDFHRLAFDQRLIVVEGLRDGTVDDVVIHMAIFTGNHLDGRDRAHAFGVDLRQVDAILDKGQERPVGTGDLRTCRIRFVAARRGGVEARFIGELRPIEGDRLRLWKQQFHTAIGRGIDILPPALYKQDLARLLCPEIVTRHARLQPAISPVTQAQRVGLVVFHAAQVDGFAPDLPFRFELIGQHLQGIGAGGVAV